ncbi:hypothetical protein AERO9AM_30200 [Aeromicrobium sp. 9AM]|nr:hypothetical protein AERO9AM_30200 [Aeromicrobium sp. 9AM]
MSATISAPPPASAVAPPSSEAMATTSRTIRPADLAGGGGDGWLVGVSRLVDIGVLLVVFPGRSTGVPPADSIRAHGPIGLGADLGRGDRAADADVRGCQHTAAGGHPYLRLGPHLGSTRDDPPAPRPLRRPPCRLPDGR